LVLKGRERDKIAKGGWKNSYERRKRQRKRNSMETCREGKSGTISTRG